MKRLVLVGVLALCGSCREKDPQPTAAATSKPAATAIKAAPAPAAPVTPRAPVVTDEAARAFVTTWLAAQNAQDFAAYESLYASRFTGIKRAGERMTQFDRVGWLKDRKQMFARGFSVEAEQVLVRNAGSSAVVSFEQAFRAQTFADRGPKQLVLVLEGGKPKIAREELLRSDVAERAQALSPSDREFAFVREIEDRYFWISRVSPEGQKVGAEPQLLRHGSAFAKLMAAELPAELRALAGAKVMVDGTCEVSLDDWGVLADFIPHFGDDRRWGGLDGEPAPPRQQIAREVFGPDEVSAQDHRYAVDITRAAIGCTSVRWARDKALPTVPAYEVEALSGEALEALRPSLRKAPEYAVLQKLFREEQPEGFWDELPNASVRGFQSRVGERRFVLASAHYFEGCQGFSGELTVAGQVQGKAVRLLPTFGARAFTPILALDLNGDGTPEWLSDTELLGWDGKTYSMVSSVEPRSYDCPC